MKYGSSVVSRAALRHRVQHAAQGATTAAAAVRGRGLARGVVLRTLFGAEGVAILRDVRSNDRRVERAFLSRALRMLQPAFEPFDSVYL